MCTTSGRVPIERTVLIGIGDRRPTGMPLVKCVHLGRIHRPRCSRGLPSCGPLVALSILLHGIMLSGRPLLGMPNKGRARRIIGHVSVVTVV
jgi:hypothetical protein